MADEAPLAPRFSPWLSLAAPHLVDERRVAPYAVLHLFVERGSLGALDRAHGLPAADLNGLSDPYVTAQDVDVRTSTQNNTLAPKWSESFYLSVYRPESILTLFVHDEDFGHEDAVGFAGSLVGLSDDLLGIVDISLEKMPLNTKISGNEWPHFILPLIILALCICLLKSSPDEITQQQPVADPALSKVFKAAETGREHSTAAGLVAAGAAPESRGGRGPVAAGRGVAPLQPVAGGTGGPPQG
eukprot:Skav217965  [mRNA]  locus=scaffold3450:136766:146826:- [translate_table: standard]